MPFGRLRTVDGTLCDEAREFGLELFAMRVCVGMVKAESVICLMYVNKSRKRVARTKDPCRKRAVKIPYDVTDNQFLTTCGRKVVTHQNKSLSKRRSIHNYET